MSQKVDKNSILDFLRENKNFFYEEYGIEKIGLFGSYAKENQQPGSDMDIVITMDNKKKNIHNFFKFKRHIEKEFGITVDVGLENTIKPVVMKSIRDEIIYA